MARTNAELVKGILGDDYGKKADGSLPSLALPLRAAAVIADRTAACASNKGVPIDGEALILIETNLAAYYYTKSDPVYASKQSGKSGGTFVRGKEEPNPYKESALELDPSGCLSGILNSKKLAGAAWLGKASSEQIPIWDRE